MERLTFTPIGLTYSLFALINCFIFTQLSAQKTGKYFTGDITDELSFNKISRSAQRATRDLEDLPANFSLKQYAPVPGFQGNHGTCVAWSAGYAARTISYCIQHQYTNPAQIKSVAFSPNYLYYFLKAPGDNNCQGGARIESAMKVLTDTGDVLAASNIADCINILDSKLMNDGKNYTIKAFSSLTNTFGRITKNEVISIKKSIAEKKPVIFSIKYFKSLDSVGQDGVWKKNPIEDNSTNHAMCIVGYDDNKFNGSFEIMNSWDTTWGNKGFFWLNYDQLMQFGSYALEMMDKEVYDPNMTRGFSPPQITGSLDLVTTDDFGQDVGSMPVLLTKLDPNSQPTEDRDKVFLTDYKLLGSYPGGTKFKIKFTINAPAFVYIFSIDDNKAVSSLFPYADNVSPAINSSNATIYLPSEQKHYTLNADGTRDRICVLFSKTIIDFDALKTLISKSTKTVYENIWKTYNGRLIPINNINFKNDRINFSSNAGEQQLLCLFIDMNHS